jgi:transposase
MGWTRPSNQSVHPVRWWQTQNSHQGGRVMTAINTIGLDLAKDVFQIHRINEHGKVVEKKRIRRNRLLSYFASIPVHLVGMEACAGSNYWARKIEALGHQTRQMNPRFVKPYIKTNKNDANDAEGICEAVTRPSMRFVPNKSQEQMDMQAMQRVRDRMVRDRTGLINQCRGLLLESGIVLPKGVAKFRVILSTIWEDTCNELSIVMRDILSDIYSRLVDLDERINKYDNKIKALSNRNPICANLMTIPGIGPITALAIFACIGNGSDFHNGRHLSAWIGLAPRQSSSGNKRQLLGISKRGNRQLRRLLVQGAHTVLRYCENKTDRVSLWAQKVLELPVSLFFVLVS